MNLEQLTAELEKKINHFDKLNLSVSAKGVDWHIDHSLRVIIGTIKSLHKSNPADYKWKFNLVRAVILTKGVIPRGKGRAPKVVNNEDQILIDDVLNQFILTKELIISLDKLSKNSNFNHPYFGLLNLRTTKLFLKIHTKHHLKIINDIIEK